MAGLPYRCASDLAAASACQQMTAARQKTAAQWGALVRGAVPDFTGRWPRVQIWQGRADYTVYPANAGELVEQWTDVWGADATADATETLGKATRTQYRAGPTIAVELYLIDGMGHAIATGADPIGDCPATTGALFSNEQICSTLRAAQFFGLVPGGDGGGSGSDGGSPGGDGGGPGTRGDREGGCSAGPGASGLVLLGVAALLGRMRPSKARSRTINRAAAANRRPRPGT